jgi:endonuclease/exonuclease/phosphatase family metal-dependent hydrolase
MGRIEQLASGESAPKHLATSPLAPLERRPFQLGEMQMRDFLFGPFLKWPAALTILLAAVILAPTSSAQNYPSRADANVVTNDPRFAKGLVPSTEGQLTLVSMNVRNFGNVGRGPKDLAALVDLIDEADVIMLQEVGLGLLHDDPATEFQQKILDSMVAQLRILFGSDWAVDIADGASGSGAGRETSLIAYRKQPPGYELSAAWVGYFDLGPKRDMAVWQLDATKGEESREISIGSVHLTPKDPDRGSQMIKMADWLAARDSQLAIALGDMNWGYQKTSRVENYLGEAHVAALDQSGKIFHLFRDISYLGKAKSDDLRTNLAFRSAGQFYDQFLLSPPLAQMLAHDGSLLKDCGIISFMDANSYIKAQVAKVEKTRSYGVTKYAEELAKSKAVPKSEAFTLLDAAALDKAKSRTENQSLDDATRVFSDHRPIWLKLKLF